MVGYGGEMFESVMGNGLEKLELMNKGKNH